MPRALLLTVVAVYLALTLQAGCSLQNPYALFGPAKVPAPASAEVAPYYPAGITASAKPKADATSARPSISVTSPAVSAPPVTRFSHTTDEEPIHIAENTKAVPPKRPASSTAPASPPTNRLAPPASPSRPNFQATPPSARTLRDSSVAPASFQTPAPDSGAWRAR